MNVFQIKVCKYIVNVLNNLLWIHIYIYLSMSYTTQSKVYEAPKGAPGFHKWKRFVLGLNPINDEIFYASLST